MHLHRVLVALIAIPLLYLALAKLPAVVFLLMLMTIGGLAQHEFYAMYRVPNRESIIAIAAGLCLYLPFLASIKGAAGMLALLLPAVIIALTSFRLFGKRTAERSLADITPLVFGIAYIPCMLIPQWLLRLEGVEWIFFLYLCVWASDTTAYYVGKNFGKQKLYPEISPKKTVQGAYGSVAGSFMAALLCGLSFLSFAKMPVLLLMGLVIGGISIVGDLVESMFKRDADIKDSGSLIPGHGGVLDRFDSVLFAGPALCMLLRIFA